MATKQSGRGGFQDGCRVEASPLSKINLNLLRPELFHVTHFYFLFAIWADWNLMNVKTKNDLIFDFVPDLCF